MFIFCKGTKIILKFKRFLSVLKVQTTQTYVSDLSENKASIKAEANLVSPFALQKEAISKIRGF